MYYIAKYIAKKQQLNLTWYFIHEGKSINFNFQWDTQDTGPLVSQQQYRLKFIRNGESGAPSKTHWVRICILTNFPDEL